MSFLIIVAAAVLAVLPAFLVISTVLIWQRLARRRKRRSPLTTELLRPPGFSLSERIDDLRLDLAGYLFVAMLFPTMVLALALVQSQSGNASPPVLLAMIHGTAIVIVLALISLRAIQLARLIRSHREGRDGEWATAQLLEPIIAGGGRVLHDLQAPGFNLDHVVIAPGGVFAIETKHRLKPTTGNGKADAEVRFDGKALRFPDWTDTTTAVQASAQARWLSDRLTRATGLPVTVRAVIALPGWFVSATTRAEVNAINPKACHFMLKPRRGEPPLAADSIQRIAYQAEQLCRLPDPQQTAGKR